MSPASSSRLTWDTELRAFLLAVNSALVAVVSVVAAAALAPTVETNLLLAPTRLVPPLPSAARPTVDLVCRLSRAWALRLSDLPEALNEKEVLSPFAGIGSEGVVAIEEGRRFVGVELKGSYYGQAARNLANAHESRDMDLFTGDAA